MGLFNLFGVDQIPSLPAAQDIHWTRAWVSAQVYARTYATNNDLTCIVLDLTDAQLDGIVAAFRLGGHEAGLQAFWAVTGTGPR